MVKFVFAQFANETIGNETVVVVDVVSSVVGN